MKWGMTGEIIARPRSGAEAPLEANSLPGRPVIEFAEVKVMVMGEITRDARPSPITLTFF